ncbi:hypothetical protein M0R45_025124 [Rubus argutus]|uniref:F-box domain-containing protein n=1 Tax=Rubus argutus TaxID=59490 RepID=A0AAW1WT65_RUBAR
MARTSCPRKHIKIDVNLGEATKIGPEDRISVLPDDILRHILSLLTLHEVGRTSILPKRWHYVRSSFPYLAFDQRFFIKNLSDIEKRKPAIEGKVEKFEKYVHGSVLKFCKHNITMRRFCLFMCLINFRYISDLDHWIWLAESLTVLRLNGCWLNSNECLRVDTIKIHFLRELCVVNVSIPEHTIQKLILGCPLINSLTLLCCWNVKNLALSSLVMLKKLELQDRSNIGDRFERIEFQELKLRSLSYSADNMVFDINSKFRKTLEVLSIKGSFMTDRLLKRIISKCVRLKSLELSCSKLKRFKISSPRLKKLSLYDLSEHLDNGVLDTPNLRSFRYDGDKVVPLLFSLDMSSVQDATLNMFYSSDLNAFQFFELRSYFGKFSQETTLTLHIISHKVTFLPEELGENISVPSPSNIKHLKLELDSPLKEKENYEALVDGLLWSSHPETLSMELGWGYNNEVAKVLCKRLSKIEQRQDCCSSARNDCWHHCLKHVKCVANNKVELISCNSLLKLLLSNLRNGQKIMFRFQW